MADETPAASEAASVRSLAKLFDSDSKRFEWMAKQYYDLFAYHAAQRLTAFNFFLVSLSFFSTAYATLISKSEPSKTNYFPVAGALAFAAYLLVISFGRLDKRNEQIVGINEKPLIRIQRAIRLGLAEQNDDGDEVWETFVQADRSVPFRTFGQLLPIIYSLAALACAAGAMYGLSGTGDQLDLRLCCGWLVMAGLAIWFINCALFEARKGEAALEEANKVKRVVEPTAPAEQAPASDVPQAETPANATPVPDVASIDPSASEVATDASLPPAPPSKKVQKPAPDAESAPAKPRTNRKAGEQTPPKASDKKTASKSTEG